MWTAMLAALSLAASPEQARAALDDAYVPYTEAAFLQHVGKDDLAMVRLFLDAGMSPDATLGGVGSAVGVAARSADIGMLDLLLARGARAEDDGQPRALCLAAARFKPDHLERLLAAGADPSGPCSAGEPTPLLVALGEGSAANARSLLAAGAAATGTTRHGGRQALHLAAHRLRLNALIPALVAAGAAVDARDGSDDTPLCRAAHHGGVDGIRHLLAAGAQPDLACSGGRTSALTLAIARDDAHLRAAQRAEAVAALLAAGARPEGGPGISDAPPPLAAIARDDAEVMRLLLDAGLDRAWRDARGRTLPELAREGGAPRIAALLATGEESP